MGLKKLKKSNNDPRREFDKPENEFYERFLKGIFPCHLKNMFKRFEGDFEWVLLEAFNMI